MSDMHFVNIENQKKIQINTVQEVNGFSDKEIRLTLISKVKISVSGQNMKISNFQKESGLFIAEGEIFGVKYLGVGQSFFKRLVK